MVESLPSREAWIEIDYHIAPIEIKDCRFPRGKRGLKLPIPDHSQAKILSLPSREAWIEIICPNPHTGGYVVASLAGSVD